MARCAFVLLAASGAATLDELRFQITATSVFPQEIVAPAGSRHDEERSDEAIHGSAAVWVASSPSLRSGSSP
jgi:hypothetical protein